MPTVTNNRRGKLRLAFGVALEPGRNEIDSATWSKCRDHPITRHYVQRGEIVVARAPVVKAMGASGAAGQSAHAVSSLGAGPPYVPESPPLPLDQPAKPKATASADTDVFGIPVNLNMMRARDAIGVAEGLHDVRALRQMLTVESRATVVRAIERRIDEVRG